MEDYYRRRAEEYEEIYYRSELVTQEEIKKIANTLKERLKGRRVLETACGTGYWTQVLSETAQSIVAIDIAQEMLEIAKRKKYRCPVSILREDAYNLSFEDGLFDGGFANFWLSHIPKSRIDSFLKGFHRVLQSGSIILMADNIYVPGLGGKLVTKEDDENTYKLRTLKDGSECLILKNYFSVDELIEIFSRYARKFGRENVFYGNRYWCVVYELK
jgi:ubiquinone/menaquinone biosynthesis C-methylase UbiE